MMFIEKTAFQRGFEKNAILGSVFRGALGLGKRVAQNPLKALGTAATVGYTASELGSSVNRASQRAARQTLGKFTNPVPGVTY